jgi:hypothetical protein
MGATGSFPIDLVLFGMIAAFLVLRLRSILGKRTGFERSAPPVPPLRPAAAPVAEPSATVAANLPQPGTPSAQALEAMRAIDRAFDPARFLAGADHAFRLIVAGFAQGDRVALRALLADETYGAFEQAIAAREKANETQHSEIKSIESMAVEHAALRGTTGSVTLRIVSDQVSFATDAAGKPVSGTDAVTEITDIWTFERDLAQQDPTWRLVAARSG